jgi:hypothetical protein
MDELSEEEFFFVYQLTLGLEDTEVEWMLYQLNNPLNEED